MIPPPLQWQKCEELHSHSLTFLTLQRFVSCFNRHVVRALQLRTVWRGKPSAPKRAADAKITKQNDLQYRISELNVPLSGHADTSRDSMDTIIVCPYVPVDLSVLIILRRMPFMYIKPFLSEANHVVE
jgi:hypothetical protein